METERKVEPDRTQRTPEGRNGHLAVEPTISDRKPDTHAHARTPHARAHTRMCVCLADKEADKENVKSKIFPVDDFVAIADAAAPNCDTLRAIQDFKAVSQHIRHDHRQIEPLHSLLFGPISGHRQAIHDDRFSSESHS